MSGHGPGPVGTCFRSPGSASFLATENWIFFLIPSQPSRLQQLLNTYATLFGARRRFRWLTWSWAVGRSHSDFFCFVPFGGERRPTAEVMADFGRVISGQALVVLFISLIPSNQRLNISWP